MIKLLFNILLFASIIVQAQKRPVITKWDLSTTKNIIINAQGSYDYTWENVENTSLTGSGVANGNVSINFPSNGEYIVKINPYNQFSFRFVLNPDIRDKNKLIEIIQWGDVNWDSNLSYSFNGCSNLTITATDIPKLNNVTNISGIFNNCLSITTIPNMNNWNTSNITNMSYMFSGASNFNQDISNWNTSNVTDMREMFKGASNFNQNIGIWNTSNVISMQAMFSDAKNFNGNIGNWDTSNVINASRMFENATKFNQNIGSWNMSKVKDMGRMFYNAINFNQDIGNWNTSDVYQMSEVFSGATNFNKDIGNWNTSEVTEMARMFSNAINFNQDISDWNIYKVYYMQGMFENATSFNQDLGSWKLRSSGFLLENMLSNSGLDCKNYSKTLKGWASQSDGPSFVLFGANGRIYGSVGQVYRNVLISKGWIFSGDTLVEECDATLSVSDLEINNLEIYPNPVRDFLNFTKEVSNVEILDLAGEISKRFPSSIKQINISTLVRGTYIIKGLDKNGKQFVKKFIKQ